MEYLRWIVFGAFFAASLHIGLRLLWLSRRTGRLPELLLGLGILGIGPLGYGMSMGSYTLLGTNSVLAATLRGGSQLAAFMGAATQFLFTWYVFRHHSRFATVLVHSAIVALAVTYALDIHQTGLLGSSQRGDAYWAGLAVRQAGLVWAVTECLAHWSRLRRRQALDLQPSSNPGRFLFWGLGMGLALAGTSLGGVVLALTGSSVSKIPAASLALSLCGLASALCLWRAFWPELSRTRLAPRAPEPVPSRVD